MPDGTTMRRPARRRAEVQQDAHVLAWHWSRSRRQAAATMIRADLARRERLAVDLPPRVSAEARPGTVEFREQGARSLQRHATQRLPDDHPEAHPIDRLYAQGRMDDRLYQNACACLALWHAAGIGRRPSVLDVVKAGGRGAPEEVETPEDVWRRLLREGGVGMAMVAMLVQGEPLGEYCLSRAFGHLSTLDWLSRAWDGRTWTFRT